MSEGNGLPGGWAETTLGYILPIHYGKGLTGKNRDENGKHPVYGSSGAVGVHSEALTSTETLVIGRKGSVGSVHYSATPCWPIDTVYFAEASKDVELKFFYHLLGYLRLGQLDKSTAVPSLSRNDYSLVPVKVPPLSEQRRIVTAVEEQFSRLDAGVAALERARANLKHYRTAVLKAAVEGKLTEAWREENPDAEPASELLERILKERRERWEQDQLAAYEKKGKKPPRNWQAKYKEPAGSDTEELPELPKGWLWVRAEQVCDFITKGTTPAAAKLHSGAGEVPFIKVYNLTFGGKLDFRVQPTFIEEETHARELARSTIFPGDVLMNIVGPPLGKVSVVPDLYPEWNMNQAIAVFRPMPSYSREFLCLSLLSR